MDVPAPAPLRLDAPTERDAGTVATAVQRDAGTVVTAIERDAAAILAAVESESTAILAAVEPDAIGLTEHQRAILDFERQWWRQPGAKEQAIRDTFEMSPTRYYQSLNLLLDLPEALHYDPTLVNRLQRLRAGATRGRGLR